MMNTCRCGLTSGCQLCMPQNHPIVVPVAAGAPGAPGPGDELEWHKRHARAFAALADKHKAEADQLRAENERLRAALVEEVAELRAERELVRNMARNECDVWKQQRDAAAAESDSLCADRDTRIAELEAECERLRQQRDYDYRNALDGFAGLNAEIEWLESVIAAGREMYERACAERDWQVMVDLNEIRAHVAGFMTRDGSEYHDGAPGVTLELLSECADEIERLRAALSAAERDGSGE